MQLLVILFLTFLATDASARNNSSASYEAELFVAGKHSEWARQPAWNKLLFFKERVFGSSDGLIDSPAFYLSPEGKKDPAKELLATVEAFFAPQDPQNRDEHALCRFPARARWLEARAGKKLPRVACPAFEQWFSQRKYQGVSLVFSSFYVNNPSSAFGHTFLKLQRHSSSKAGLLDDAVNFAGQLTADSGAFEMLKGVVGGIPGVFSLMPYYIKVQEYNNSERRDLWEYNLNFTADEIENLVLILWDIGPHSIDYFYFDENCSAILLMVLNAAKPAIDLMPPHPWVIPSDTIHAVAAQPNLVKDIHYRPSSLGVFLARYHDLTAAEKKLLKEIVEDQKLAPSLDTLSKKEKARVLDAFLDYIDFKEKVAGDFRAGEWEKLRREALKARAKLALSNALTPEPPIIQQPHRGHQSSRWGLGLAHGDKITSLVGEWRPAYHDRLSSPSGFAENLEIEFFRSRGILHDFKTLLISEWHLIRIASYSMLPSIVRSPDWELDAFYSREPLCVEGCGEGWVRGSIGSHLDLGSKAYLYGRALVGAGYSNTALAAGGVVAGGFWRFNSKVVGVGEWERLLVSPRKNKRQWRTKATASMAFLFKPNLEWRLEGSQRDSRKADELIRSREVSLTVFHYF